MLITRTSIFSRLTRTLDLPVTEDQVLAHENGALLQDAFPNLTAEEREFCKTGMTAEECNQMFTEEQKQAIPKPEEEEKWIVPPPQPPLKLTLNLDVEPVREEEITTKQPKPIRDSGAVSKKVYLTKYYYKNRLKQLRPILKYLGEEVIFLRKENQRLAEKYDNLAKEFISLDRISEFGAEGFSITTHPVIGLQRWADKQYMISFFPTDIKGNRLQYQNGIDKVYDLFLTEEQVEVIVEEYNKRNKNV